MSNLYDPLAVLIETHKNTIAEHTAQSLLALNMPGYSGQNVANMSTRIAPNVEMVARYARSGDPSEYREYLVKVCETMLDQGYPLDSMLTAGSVMFEKIHEIVEQELAGPANEKERSRYIRRLEGVKGLGRTTAMTLRVRRGLQH